MKIPDPVLLSMSEPPSFVFDLEQPSLQLLTLGISIRRVPRCPRFHLHQLGVGVAFKPKQAKLEGLIRVPNGVEVIECEGNLPSNRLDWIGRICRLCVLRDDAPGSRLELLGK